MYMAKKPNILGAGITFRSGLTRLNKSRITRLVQHHMAHQSWGITEVHNFHRNGNGWSGIGYNWWIDFDGNIYEGRGWNQGAHASGYNTTSLGIGYQGDFTKQKMPDAQLRAGIELNNWLMAELGLSTNAIIGHNQIGNTACPGRNFRMSELKSGTVSGGTSKGSSSENKSGVKWIGTDDKGKELIVTASAVNYYDTQRWSNPTGSKKRGFKWKIDNLYEVDGSRQYRVQDSNGNLFFTTARKDLVKVGGNYNGSSRKASSSLPNAVYRASRPFPSGSGVRAVQEALASVYYYPDKGAKNNGIDGVYGPKTADAVRRFQSMHGLSADGVYGAKTKAALEKAMK